jgi:hypothetical protein
VREDAAGCSAYEGIREKGEWGVIG